MARLIIKSDNNDESIELIISAADAFRILGEFQNKYPNAIKSNMTIEQFINRWTRKV